MEPHFLPNYPVTVETILMIALCSDPMGSNTTYHQEERETFCGGGGFAVSGLVPSSKASLVMPRYPVPFVKKVFCLETGLT